MAIVHAAAMTANHAAYRYAYRTAAPDGTLWMLILFAGLPMIASSMGWSRYARHGFIMLLGSYPAAAFFSIEMRFFFPRIAVAPPTDPWGFFFFDATLVLLLAAQSAGAFIAFRGLKEFHASVSQPS